MSGGVVKIRNLVKTFPNERGQPAQTAVKDISLDVHDGEFMVLVGPSGCGKTTTLRLIAGLEEVTSGTIEIDGADVTHLEPKDRSVAMVFQNYALYPHMTVFDNMAFGLKVAKKRAEDIRDTVLRASAILGLDQVLDRKPQEISGGQRQRVALGRAMVRSPKVFLFDEPLSNLDAQMRVQMRSEIARLRLQLRTTTIYVTHDQNEAMTMGDRICVLRDGTVMQVADPITVYRKPANLFVAGFIGSPPMNLIRGKVERRGGDIVFAANPEFGALAFPLTNRLAQVAEGQLNQPIILGVRPEDLKTAARNGQPLPNALSVEFSEQLGPESILYLKSGARTLAVRVFGEHTQKPGDTLPLSVDLDKARLFDPKTENAIG